MKQATRHIGLSLGADICWPICYETLMRRLDLAIPHDGEEVRFVESRDGHCWENWRDRLREGLSWLFPGPLWHVYE